MKVYSYTHIGNKENNEDSIGLYHNVFMVCDGVPQNVMGAVSILSSVWVLLEDLAGYVLRQGASKCNRGW